MRAALAIAHKDLRIYLSTATSYVLLAAFTLVAAFFFERLVADYQLRSMQMLQAQAPEMAAAMNLTDWVMGPLLLNVTVFFLFLLPVLTMRLVAEERRGRTLELLLTQPVRSADIVLGKYLAGLTMMALMLAATAPAAALLAHLGQAGAEPALDWRTVATAYAGMALMGAAFVAVGLLASSVTDSQLVAVVLGFSALLLFYLAGLAARGQEGAWAHLLSYVALSGHLEPFLRGLLRVGDVVYYASLIATALYFTHRVVEAERWQ